MISCSDSDPEEEGLLARSVRSLKIVADSSQEVAAYKAEWVAPGDPEGLLAYHVWVHLDNFNSDLILKGEVADSDFSSSATSKYFGPLTDRITSGSLETQWFLPDSLLTEIESQNLDSVLISVFAEYNSGTNGIAPYQTLYLRDVFAADPIQYDLSKAPDSLVLTFSKPTDITQLVPLNQTGDLFGYEIKLSTVSDGSKVSDLQVEFSNGVALLNKRVPNESTGDTLAIDDLIDVSVDTLTSIVVVENNTEGEREIVLKGLTHLTDYLIEIETIDLLGNRDIVDGVSLNALIDTITTTTLNPPVLNGGVDYEIVPGVGIVISHPGIEFKTNRLEIPVRFYWQIIDTLNLIGDTLDYSFDLTTDDFAESYVDTIPYVYDYSAYNATLWVQDSSGHLSIPFDTTFIGKSLDQCPKGFAFQNGICIAIKEFKDSTGFVSNLSAHEAQSYCQSLSDASYDVDVCDETQWVNSCNSILEGDTTNTALSHGVIEVESIENSLFQICGLAAGDENANDLRCVNNYGVQNLPANRQEWVRATDTNDVAVVDSFVIKGASYVAPSGFAQSDNMLFAQCKSVIRGAKKRDVIAVYHTGENFDNLAETNFGQIVFLSDTNYTEDQYKRVFELEDFDSRHIVYDVSKGAEVVGQDTINQVAIEQNPSYLSSVSKGYDYNPLDTLETYVLDIDELREDPLYRAPQLGFRCCASKK